MPDSILLVGDGWYEYSDTGSYAGTGAFTHAAIIKSSDAIGDEYFFNFNSVASGGFALDNATPPHLYIYDGTTVRDSSLTLADNEWHLVAVTKAAGTTTPRFHRYRYSDANWVHENAPGGTLPNFPAPIDVRILGVSAEELEGNALILGMWDSELSDGAIEALIFTKQSWIDAAPDILWRFDSIAEPVVPLIGNPTYFQRVGTQPTLDVGDAPAGWSDGFPTTGILDTFTGGTEDPLTFNWSGPMYPTEGQLQRVSGVARHATASGASAAASYWDAATFGPDCEAYYTLVSKPNDDATQSFSVYARVVSPGTGSMTGYLVHVEPNGAGDIVQIKRMDNSASHLTLGANIDQEVSVGDSVGIECIGDQISAWYKAGAGSWTLLGTRTDATYSAAGNIAPECGPSGPPNCDFDDFGGGTISEGLEGEAPRVPISRVVGSGVRW